MGLLYDVKECIDVEAPQNILEGEVVASDKGIATEWISFWTTEETIRRGAHR